MKKRMMFAGAFACAVLAQAALITDVIDNDGSWSQYGGNWNSGLAAGITPQAGTNYFNIYTTGNWNNYSIDKDFGVTLQAGYTYSISIQFGDKNNTVFVPTAVTANPYNARLSFGFFDPSGVVGGSDVRDAIQALGGNADITTSSFVRSIPTTDWSTWSYDMTVAEGSALDGLAVNFGVGWNSGGTSDTRGIAFDDLSISIIPEPATLGLVGFSSLGTLVLRRFMAIG